MQAEPGSGRILIAEDNWLLADQICGLVLEHGLDPIGPVATVEAALRLVSQAPPDAAVLDIRLGDRLCFPVCHALTARRIPFVLLTGARREDIPLDHRSALILTKPFDPPVLHSVLQAMLHGSHRHPGAARST